MRVDADGSTRAGEERSENGLSMKFVYCPAGSFQMGSIPKIVFGYRSAVPVSVTLRHEFWMGRFEVKQAQWKQLMGATLREQRAMDLSQPRPVGDDTLREHVGEGADYPIYYVSFDDAKAFCRKLNGVERDAGRLPRGLVYRLPTEAEWEYACRAATTSATAFGDQLGSLDANFDGSKPFNKASTGPYLRETVPVGQYPGNAWGLHDMHGNVWEWCIDSYAESLKGGLNPLLADSGDRHVMRGGCWHNPGSMCLSTSRGWGTRDTRGSGLGFRVVLASTEE